MFDAVGKRTDWPFVGRELSGTLFRPVSVTAAPLRAFFFPSTVVLRKFHREERRNRRFGELRIWYSKYRDVDVANTISSRRGRERDRVITVPFFWRVTLSKEAQNVSERGGGG